MVMCSGTTDGKLRPNAKENGHHAAQRPSERLDGAGGRHGAPLLRRKSVSIHTSQDSTGEFRPRLVREENRWMAPN